LEFHRDHDAAQAHRNILESGEVNAMLAEAELKEYRDAIREQVCSRCVERPPGGPPCAPLGKECGVEMHLPQLVQSIREVHSELIAPYLEHNRRQICAHCSLLHGSLCPCPMDYLSVLIVDAVESVDRRRKEREHVQVLQRGQPASERPGLAAVREAYRQATGAWTGCDWTTTFGKTCLNLNGRTAAAAAAMAEKAVDPEAARDWREAARWLYQVERSARDAEEEGAAAVEAAGKGEWREALEHAERAWALEFSTGRPIWHSFPVAWQRFRRAVEAAFVAHEKAGHSTPCCGARE
jgi:hypothetical protein